MAVLCSLLQTELSEVRHQLVSAREEAVEARTQSLQLAEALQLQARQTIIGEAIAAVEATSSAGRADPPTRPEPLQQPLHEADMVRRSDFDRQLLLGQGSMRHPYDGSAQAHATAAPEQERARRMYDRGRSPPRNDQASDGRGGALNRDGSSDDSEVAGRRIIASASQRPAFAASASSAAAATGVRGYVTSGAAASDSVRPPPLPLPQTQGVAIGGTEEDAMSESAVMHRHPWEESATLSRAPTLLLSTRGGGLSSRLPATQRRSPGGGDRSSLSPTRSFHASVKSVLSPRPPEAVLPSSPSSRSHRFARTSTGRLPSPPQQQAVPSRVPASRPSTPSLRSPTSGAVSSGWRALGNGEIFVSDPSVDRWEDVAQQSTTGGTSTVDEGAQVCAEMASGGLALCC
jgi:hypothetical protein